MPFVKLAVDENNVVKVQDGKPVYLDENEKEVPLDAPQMYQKILDLGKESKKHRETAEGLKKQFELFEGVEDVMAYKAEADKAIETVKNLNEKDWLKADKVDSMKRQMKEAHEQEVGKIKTSFEENIGKLTETLTRKADQIRKLVVSNKFSAHPYFSGPKPKTSMTADVAEAMFGRNVKVEEVEATGDILARCYYNNGDLIYSKANPGEPASFNEGVIELFDIYPNKDRYVETSGGGSGAGGGGGGHEPTDDISILQKQYDTAVAAKDTQTAIALKNKIFDLRTKARGRGRAA